MSTASLSATYIILQSNNVLYTTLITNVKITQHEKYQCCWIFYHSIYIWSCHMHSVVTRRWEIVKLQIECTTKEWQQMYRESRSSVNSISFLFVYGNIVFLRLQWIADSEAFTFTEDREILLNVSRQFSFPYCYIWDLGTIPV